MLDLLGLTWPVLAGPSLLQALVLVMSGLSLALALVNRVMILDGSG